MAAQTVNFGGISEPFTPLLAVYLPVSGSINDVKLAYDRNVLGPLLNINHGATGVWVITFTNNFPTADKLVITFGVENDSPSSGDIISVLNPSLSGAALRVDIFAVNVSGGGTVTVPARDRTAWVKVEKSVF